MNAFVKILDAEDLLGEARRCIECISLATDALCTGTSLEDKSDPIRTVADIAVEKIGEAIELLKEYREPESTQAFEEAKARLTPFEREQIS